MNPESSATPKGYNRAPTERKSMGLLNSILRPHRVNRIAGGKKMGTRTPRGRFLAAPYRRSQVLVWLLIFLLPSGASAVLPPWVYQEARATALFHVQVKILKVAGPAQTPGPCVVTGEVVRIFRDKQGSLKQGGILDFAVDCSKPDDPVIVGGTLWTNYDSLRKAKYLEVFLNSTARGYEVALWQSRIIEAPTEQPTFLN